MSAEAGWDSLCSRRRQRGTNLGIAVDELAVRNTRDVDILVRREDLDRIREVLKSTGFVFRRSAGFTMFLDNQLAKARDSVHLVFCQEMVRDDDPEPNPDVEPFEYGESFRTLPLETLVRMKLNAHRLKDRVHFWT